MTSGITSKQEKQYKRFVEDAAEQALAEAGLDKKGLQRLFERGGEFKERVKARMVEAIHEFSVNGRYANEEVASSYTYPNGYAPKSIAEQVATLRALFPELKDATYDESIAARALPPGAEAWFAILRWEKLAGSYGNAVDKVLETIASKRSFYNYRQGQTGPKHLREHAKTVAALQQIGKEQAGHDILIVAAQFGLRYRGKSIRRARDVMGSSEFGLGAFAVGCMLLTHPERETQWEQLHVDCAGDEFAPDADGDFVDAPVFYHGVDEVRFPADIVGGPDARYGSASAFLPQSA